MGVDSAHREVFGPGNRRVGGSRSFDGSWRRRLLVAGLVGFVLVVAAVALFADIRSPSVPKLFDASW